MLRQDNAKDECSEEVTNINRELYVEDQFSEPNHPHQNPVEVAAIRWLKDSSHVLLDRTGAPDAAWFFACKYLSEIHMVTYNKQIGCTPYQKRKGVMPNISAYLQCQFWKKIYFKVDESSPSTKELPGHWLGASKTVGDAMTFEIYSPASGKVLQHSAI